MTVFFCILGADIRRRFEWILPFLPRIGEHISILDFIPDLDHIKVKDGVLVIDSIQWFVLNGEVCTAMFLEHEEHEKLDIDFIKLVN
ncbi:hypothetical protein M2T79_18430 [Elizabethkingia miricola]|uniref:hypothetical protein n=1 Tax=Elizabethkingia miricola TaxID=172045 RepID=UPI002019A247|nr:hypothetical protein [Elizabethkingia miricola]MCL1658587.1 hypothetical protein [Elizabethkingia miricola]